MIKLLVGSKYMYNQNEFVLSQNSNSITVLTVKRLFIEGLNLSDF